MRGANFMTLEMLQEALVSARESRDLDRKSVLISAIGAIEIAALQNNLAKDNLSDDLINEALLQERKALQECLDICPSELTERRADLEKKLSIINEYCPEDSLEIATEEV